MNKRVRISLVLLITFILLLGLTIPGLAKKTPTYHIEYKFPEVNWDEYSADGDFTLEAGSGIRSGDAYVDWFSTPGVVKGTMTFTNGDGYPQGGFVIQFAIPTMHQEGCGYGSFQIIEKYDEYAEYLGGNGTIMMCRYGDHHVSGTLDGWAK